MPDLETIMQSVREPLVADGADLVLVSEDGGVVSLRLVLDNVDCLECILPKEHLETVVLSQLKKELPFVRSVTIDDPR